MEKMIIVYFFNVNLILMSQSAPVVTEEHIKWRENTLTPVWLPAAPIRNDQYPVDYNLLMKHKNEDKNNWEIRSVYGSLPEIKSALPRQIGNRPPKKDSILSRSWGAGGLPFSVLYMNSRGSRIQPTADTKTTTRKPIENTSTVKNRANSRNGPGRRQYSIIPQLLISYGWSPFGK
ncbi:GSCOCG00010176001-RA-CDS [Cotesia congregata]|uniref:Uncharacterized protein n=1 Tax=Cotesia congregata TaxID=51543 RepID=A0A8J2MP29_COTCN|nr:GSCOCG00010176001-RA-CDS [Cotesia congregata]CAG5085184.1 Protein of unknown function [Cotesia congregata]